MAENDFLPFAAASGANVLDQADYAAASATATGFVSGVASSQAVNKTLRQTSIIAAAIAKFIVNEIDADVIDDGTLDTIIANFVLAIRAANPSAGGTVTGVTGNAPITSSGGTTPAIGISAATKTAAGSMSAADKTKLDSLSQDSAVVHIAGAETITGSKTFSGTLTVFGGSSGAGYANQVAATFAGNQSGHGGGILLADTSSTAGSAPFKVIRSQAGKLEYINSANTAVISSLDDSGNGAFSGSLTCATFNATASDRRLKRNVRKFKARPLHRTVPFVSYVLKESGWQGLGSIAQNVQKVAPEHVGEFEQDGKKYLSLNYAGMAYEQAMWAGHEIDRLTKRIDSLERKLARASIQPRQRGLLRLLLEAIW